TPLVRRNDVRPGRTGTGSHRSGARTIDGGAAGRRLGPGRRDGTAGNPTSPYRVRSAAGRPISGVPPLADRLAGARAAAWPAVLRQPPTRSRSTRAVRPGGIPARRAADVTVCLAVF